jgi:hypothetical protein
MKSVGLATNDIRRFLQGGELIRGVGRNAHFDDCGGHSGRVTNTPASRRQNTNHSDQQDLSRNHFRLSSVHFSLGQVQHLRLSAECNLFYSKTQQM